VKGGWAALAVPLGLLVIRGAFAYIWRTSNRERFFEEFS
jgi:hypothetical protein